MARATEAVLATMGVLVHRVMDPARAAPAVSAGSRLAFESHRAVAVLLSQEMLGSKPFESAAGDRG
jgi:sulfopyruvate decarboxylase TPP-binding subunit